MACILALDVGTKTIGIARANVDARLPTPHSTLKRKGVKQDVARLQHLVSELEVGTIVVGLPYELDGTEGRSARLARQIGDALADATALPVHYQDERYSTVVAEERLRAAGHDARRRRETIDQAAAAVILGDYLNRTD
jgi:putative Holliday junction resolvase